MRDAIPDTFGIGIKAESPPYPQDILLAKSKKHVYVMIKTGKKQNDDDVTNDRKRNLAGMAELRSHALENPLLLAVDKTREKR